MKNKIIKDALALTLITLVAGVALGGVYEITKDPIARKRRQKQRLMNRYLRMQQLLRQ